MISSQSSDIQHLYLYHPATIPIWLLILNCHKRPACDDLPRQNHVLTDRRTCLAIPARGLHLALFLLSSKRHVLPKAWINYFYNLQCFSISITASYLDIQATAFIISGCLFFIEARRLVIPDFHPSFSGFASPVSPPQPLLKPRVSTPRAPLRLLRAFLLSCRLVLAFWPCSSPSSAQCRSLLLRGLSSSPRNMIVFCTFLETIGIQSRRTARTTMVPTTPPASSWSPTQISDAYALYSLVCQAHISRIRVANLLAQLHRGL